MDIARLCKEILSRQNPIPEQLKIFPENPAGFIELSDDYIDEVMGGSTVTWQHETFGCCATANLCLQTVLISCENPEKRSD
jgi:mersacidin/lichenicidin family type 2 lantibiotic